MRHLLNTLFVTSEDIYLSLDGENVVANREKTAVARYPLHTLSSILTFSYSGTSPALMGACAQRGISLSFCTPRGKFLARVTGGPMETCCCAAPSTGLQTTRLRAVPSPGLWCSGKSIMPDGASSALAGTTAFEWMTSDWERHPSN